VKQAGKSLFEKSAVKCLATGKGKLKEKKAVQAIVIQA
jgi:hypothetical protein